MRGGEGFAEVLEEKLRTIQPQGPVVAPAPPAFGPIPFYPFLVVEPPLRGRAVAPPPRQEPPAPPRRRSLTARQQRALDEIVGLGANLRADFTARELRSAFLVLARRYHPDRHPASSDAEKARLSSVFAALNENNQRLMAVVKPAATTH